MNNFKNIIIGIFIIITIISVCLFSCNKNNVPKKNEIDSLKASNSILQRTIKKNEDKVDSLALLLTISKNNEDNLITKINSLPVKIKVEKLIERYGVIDTTAQAAIYTDLTICETKLTGCNERTEEYKEIITTQKSTIDTQAEIIKNDSVIDVQRVVAQIAVDKKLRKTERKLKRARIGNKILGTLTLAATAIAAYLYTVK